MRSEPSGDFLGHRAVRVELRFRPQHFQEYSGSEASCFSSICF